jgi:YD repeat-containing protein
MELIVKVMRKFGFLFVVTVVLHAWVINAEGQSSSCNMDPWPKNGRCLSGFTVWPGDVLPAGGHCWCDGIPRVAAQCYIPIYSCAPHSDDVCPTCPKGGQPIALSTGNTYIEQTDVRVPGLSRGLTLSRVWNSRTGGAIGIFGRGWRSTYEESVSVSSEHYIDYWRGDDSIWSFGFYSFDPAGSGYGVYWTAAPANQGASLLGGKTNWILTFKDGEKRVFDAKETDPVWHLLSIVDRNGNPTQILYDVSGRLSGVVDPAGRHLYFNYGPNGLVQTVTTDFGISLTYSYDAQQRLTQVTYPDSTFKTFEYDINSYITAVKDAQGKILESHTYNACGQGLSSAQAGGVNGLTVAYPLTCALELP